MIMLFYLIILPIYQDGLFDRVLKLRGLRHILEANHGNDVVKCMRGVNGGLFILLCQIIVLILTLPLNLIPILGQIMYATINGWILTFGIRFHYDAEIRNVPLAQSRREAWSRKAEYTSFGAVAVGLEMIPIANLLFMWTNIVGCALWVADEIEKEERHQQQIAQEREQQQQQQNLQGAGRTGSIMSTPESLLSSYSPPTTAALLGSGSGSGSNETPHPPPQAQKGLSMMPALRKK
ncbi:hypothetical protein BGZ95_002508 [Linnemannia exigua]|uniref:Uncharacterized protein n=1 Tax=Linnemannia exigua TaxID=604196 RepID=A0AAD4D5U9_9FUNG|nr:hypothetical protein BGZ95_002508 [Linnemannia exigua]